MLRYIRNLFGFGSTDTTPSEVIGGADEVFHAILENMDDGRLYTVELGEPELIDRGGEFATDYMVRIPTRTPGNDPEPPNIEYDLPDGEIEETSNDLFDLLSLYGIDEVADLSALEGKTVPAIFESGILSLQFEELEE